ncbi:MAG: class I SAM-dependent methyltransferase, partial [Acidobacteria bacterium]
KLHRIGKVGVHVPISYDLSDQALHLIDRNVDQNSHTLETGAGISTILFAIKHAHHTCIVPDGDLVDRIREYCQRRRISVERIDFHIEKSENILPGLISDQLDLVLIDGQHAFPAPFIDWYYTARKLKIGVMLLIDDIQLWTGRVLKDFLNEEPEWRLIKELSGRTAAFIKEKDYSQEKWWGQQPYIVRKSRRLIRASELRQAFAMLAQGKVRPLKSKIMARMRGE